MSDSLPTARVVVADDDADMRLYVRSCIEAAELCDVVEAADGIEALRLARADATTLLVCDLGMPGLDGASVCRALKDDDATADIHVLVISGETRSASLPCADGFLLKPFNASTLRAQVHRLLHS